MVTYADAGVDIEKGDEASRIMYEAAKATWQNRKGKRGEITVPFDDFSGLRAVNVSSLPKDTFMSMGLDGIGTKSEIAERLGKHDTMAFDLVAMVADDAVVRGGEPALLGSTLEINKIDISTIKQLARGYTQAANDAGVAIINGEIAEMGTRVQGFGPCNYNWSSSLIWFGTKEHMLTGKELRVGDALVSFKEEGFRSNGLSLLRKIMKDSWTKETLLQALTPSKIYSKAVVEMFGHVTGVAHITGGGIPGKVGRILRASGLGARFDNLFEPPKLMIEAIERGNVPIQDAYSTWNMGNGMVVATKEPELVISVAKKHGIKAQVSGEIVKEKGVKIK